MRDIFKTEGEKLFAKLLKERGLSCKYELKYTGKNSIPDFTLTFAEPNIICEVRDLDLNDEDEAIITSLSNNHTSSWEQNQPYKRIRRVLEKKADQVKEYTDHPTFVVMYRNPQNLTTDLSTNNILESIFADKSLVFSFDNTGNMNGKTEFNAKNAVLRKDKNTHVSAVGIIENYSPYTGLANEIVKEYKRKGGNALTERGQTELTKLFDEKRNEGIDFDLQVLRFRIIHNWFTKTPLKIGFMSSVYDEEIYLDVSSNRLKKRCNDIVTNYLE